MSSTSRDGLRVDLIARLVIFVMLVLPVFLPMTTSADTGEACAECHTDIAEVFGNTAHGMLFVGSDNDCQSCHGNGTQHIEEGGDPDLIINPANVDQFGARQMCLTCHKDRGLGSWDMSSHAAADISCTACHTVHGTYGETVKKQGEELCYDCHSDVRTMMSMPSHHPVAEGKMECADCHSVHGGGTDYAMDMTARERCFTCHAEKEGPFVYEHAPVSEGCMTCHNPHGTVADNLLVQNEPALCLSCHPMHFHASAESIDGTFTPPQAPDRVTESTFDGWKVTMLTKCTQCHTEVHGSDLPSQSISTGGTGLTR